MTFCRCFSTVLMLIPSWALTPLLGKPSAMSCSTSSSRVVSAHGLHPGRAILWAASLRRCNALVISALKYSLLRRTARIASANSQAAAFLLRNPFAPASMSFSTHSQSSYELRTKTLACGTALAIWRVASRPFKPGMPISMTITSGRLDLASSTACNPVLASPIISMSTSGRNKARIPSRTTLWSSASKTLTFSMTRWHRGPWRSLQKWGVAPLHHGKTALPRRQTWKTEALSQQIPASSTLSAFRQDATINACENGIHLRGPWRAISRKDSSRYWRGHHHHRLLATRLVRRDAGFECSASDQGRSLQEFKGHGPFILPDGRQRAEADRFSG